MEEQEFQPWSWQDGPIGKKAIATKPEILNSIHVVDQGQTP